MTCGHDDSAHTGPANQGTSGDTWGGRRREGDMSRKMDGRRKQVEEDGPRTADRSSGRSRFPANDACLLACPTSISDSSPLPPSTLSAFDLPFRSLRVPSFHKSRSFSSPSLATNVILLLRTCVNYLKLYTSFEMIILLSMKSDKFFIEYGFQKKGKNPSTPYVTTRKRIPRHCPS